LTFSKRSFEIMAFEPAVQVPQREVPPLPRREFNIITNAEQDKLQDLSQRFMSEKATIFVYP